MSEIIETIKYLSWVDLISDFTKNHLPI